MDRATLVYDPRTNQRFTLEQNPLRRQHLDDVVSCSRHGRPRSERVESERVHSSSHDELVARDEANLGITWLRDAALADFDSQPAPEVIAREVVEDPTAALAEFEAVAAALEASAAERTPMRPSPTDWDGLVGRADADRGR